MFTYANILSKAGVPSMFAILTQRRLRWLGQVCRMDDGHLPKDILHGELATGKRPMGHPALTIQGHMQVRDEGLQPEPRKPGAGCV